MKDYEKQKPIQKGAKRFLNNSDGSSEAEETPTKIQATVKGILKPFILKSDVSAKQSTLLRQLNGEKGHKPKIIVRKIVQTKSTQPNVTKKDVKVKNKTQINMVKHVVKEQEVAIAGNSRSNNRDKAKSNDVKPTDTTERVEAETPEASENNNHNNHINNLSQEERNDSSKQNRANNITNSQILVSDFSTTNPYEYLRELNDDDEEITMDFDDSERRDNERDEEVNNDKSSKAGPNSKNEPRKKRVNHQAKDMKATFRGGAKSKEPPIYIFNTRASKLLEILKGKVDLNVITIKNLSQIKMSLTVNGIEVFNNVLTILRENEIEFYTRAPISERIHSWILKGIADDYDEEYIADELNDLNLENVNILKVKKISLKEFFKSKKGGYAFLVQVTSDSNSNNLTNVDRLVNQSAQWERIRREVGIQCFNCQRLGHVAKYCNRSYRCVKCSENHGPNECKITKQNVEDKSKLFCVNCQTMGHPAPTWGALKFLNSKEK